MKGVTAEALLDILPFNIMHHHEVYFYYCPCKYLIVLCLNPSHAPYMGLLKNLKIFAIKPCIHLLTG